jgi:hypothetical protein
MKFLYGELMQAEIHISTFIMRIKHNISEIRRVILQVKPAVGRTWYHYYVFILYKGKI